MLGTAGSYLDDLEGKGEETYGSCGKAVSSKAFALKPSLYQMRVRLRRALVNITGGGG